MDVYWGTVIRHYRLERGMTQNELAAKIGIGRTVLANYERGTVKKLEPSFIPKLAKAFDMPADQLFKDLFTKPNTYKQTMQQQSNDDWLHYPIVRVPVVGSVPTEQIDLRDKSRGYIYIPQEYVIGINKDGLRGLLVLGSTMSTDDIDNNDNIHPFDLIVFDTEQRVIVNGKIYISKVSDLGIVLTRVYQDNKQIKLKADWHKYR